MRLWRRGANDYIVKPVDLPTLIKRVDAVLTNTLLSIQGNERVANIGKPVAAPDGADTPGLTS